jgi:hypothetical protein
VLSVIPACNNEIHGLITEGREDGSEVSPCKWLAFHTGYNAGHPALHRRTPAAAGAAQQESCSMEAPNLQSVQYGTYQLLIRHEMQLTCIGSQFRSLSLSTAQETTTCSKPSAQADLKCAHISAKWQSATYHTCLLAYADTCQRRGPVCAALASAIAESHPLHHHLSAGHIVYTTDCLYCQRATQGASSSL